MLLSVHCMISIAILFIAILIGSDCASHAQKRQTFIYDNELRKYARPHQYTKVYHGTVGRFAPQEWPNWYTRTLFKWNGEVRQGPYHETDRRYAAYRKARAQAG